jgi:hypothetical protein
MQRAWPQHDLCAYFSQVMGIKGNNWVKQKQGWVEWDFFQSVLIAGSETLSHPFISFINCIGLKT